MSKAKTLVPTFLGAFGGACLVLFSPWEYALVVVAVGAALLVLMWSVYLQFNRSPRLWAAVLELWILFLPVATALAVFLLLWLTIRVDPESLPRPEGWTGEEMADLVKYVAGVVTGLAAALVSGDPEENAFWPAFHFKRLAGRAVNSSAKEDPVRFYAAHMPATLCNTAKNWGFRARRIRADLIANGASAGAAEVPAACVTASPVHEPEA